MKKMTKGWDKESARHSAAAKFGKAPPYRSTKKITSAQSPPTLKSWREERGGGSFEEYADRILTDYGDTPEIRAFIGREDAKNPPWGSFSLKKLISPKEKSEEKVVYRGVLKVLPADIPIIKSEEASGHVQLTDVYDERDTPDWSNEAQKAINFDRQKDQTSYVVHRGDLHYHFTSWGSDMWGKKK